MIKSSREFYNILGIKDNVLIHKGGFYSKILEIYPENFVFSDLEERSRFILRYKEFLLSLKIEIQIVVINFKVKKTNILKYTNNIGDKKLQELYINAILNDQEDILKNIFNQRFFVVYSIYRKRKSLDFSKDFSFVKEEFKSQERQLKYSLGLIPLVFEDVGKREIKLILENYYK